MSLGEWNLDTGCQCGSVFGFWYSGVAESWGTGLGFGVVRGYRDFSRIDSVLLFDIEWAVFVG